MLLVWHEANGVPCLWGKKPKLIQSNRVQSFRDASEQHGDGLSEKFPKGELLFTCHRSCISTYCSKHHIELCLSKRKVETCDAPPSPKKLRGKCTLNFLQDWYGMHSEPPSQKS